MIAVADEQLAPPVAAEQEAPVAASPVPAVDVASSAPDDLMHAIFNAVREELDISETDEGSSDGDLMLEMRTVDKAVVSNAQGKPIITFEVGKEFPSLPGSRTIALFVTPVEGTMPGDLRIYVAPALPLAGGRDYLCFTFNRMSLGQAKEVMAREVFVREVGMEFAALLDPDDEDGEEGDEDDEELECGVDDCDEAPAYVCACQVCAPAVDEAKFYACGAHRSELDLVHVKENKRPAKWEKLPQEAAS